ncbi:MAG: imidazole glycerol phosphate synthase subunit HisH [Nitrosomonadaceae bacterium]|nr:imidazole glycerol phosphate synthase subunit HisH [Nitrosomonadaceae bacterium]|tara:strand:- start:1065 stop:1715 length:651 start_codon:yes stop_codon:yes gene_type:complete
MADIAIIDYGMGNLHSVSKAFECIAPATSIIVTSDPNEVRKAARVVFPGQGAMPNCMREMDALGLREAIVESAEKKPFLGICIGLQMLFENSEEGNVEGLGILPGLVRRFPDASMIDTGGQKLKVPHMGWNQVNQLGDHPIWEGIAKDERFYFVHSYFVDTIDQNQVAAKSVYSFPFVCAIAKDNIFAVQFHPEKSDKAGLILLKNFVHWQPVFSC